eukprot:3636825-Alexandrium_andersonii.AAC.1
MGWSSGASSSGSMRRQGSQSFSANTRSAGRARASARLRQSSVGDCRSGRFGGASWRPRGVSRWTRMPASAPSTS